VLDLKTETLTAPTDMDYWGYHLMLDCAGCQNIDSRAHIYNFVKDLTKSIGMTPHGEPVIEHLLLGDPNQGFSLMQLITTSNICGHFMELNGTAYFDVFSCKEFDPKIVKQLVSTYFEPSKIKTRLIKRRA